ncbi:hypothetical protein J2X53_000110 [Pseudorhodobacter sp. 4114]|nr:hypothetical protein [Pseudorhodobacter sp. 4114]
MTFTRNLRRACRPMAVSGLSPALDLTEHEDNQWR